MIAVFFTKRTLISGICCLCALYGSAQTIDTTSIIQDSLRVLPLKTVTVVGQNNIRRNNTYQFSLKDIKPLVSVMGETDVLRYIGTLPGVSQGMEGGLGFFVRGSNSGNNRVELDGVPIYGSAHLFGLFSVLPPDVVADVAFRSGNLPASSGNFLASLTQISTMNPDTVRYRGNFSLSPFMTSISLNGPLVKNKLSFQVAGRISVLKPEIQLLKSMTELEGDISPQVADFYAKLHYLYNERHTIDVSAYYSNDYFRYQNAGDFDSNNIEENWGNTISRISWTWQLAEHWQLNTMTYFNRFFSGMRQQNTFDGIQRSDLRLQTSFREWSAQSVLNYRQKNWDFSVGLQGKSQRIQPAAEKVFIGQNKNDSDDHFSFNPATTSGLFTAFGDLEYKYNIITSSIGYRGSYYTIGNQSIWDNNLRLALAIEISKEAGWEFSYDQLSQFHHIVEGLPVGWSLDLIIPSDKSFVPGKAQQYYTGGFWTNSGYLLSAGVYYKDMDHLVSYKHASNIFGIQYATWMEEVVSGQGKSYGLEARAERKGENWNAALSYTLSKTDRHFDEINDGKRFPFKFDRRHILNFTGQILTRKRETREQHFNLAIALSSGHNITLPIAMYKGIEPPYWERQNGIYLPPREQENALYRQLMSETNGYSLPYYLRVDIGYNFHKTGKRFTNDLTLGIFNVLNRQNPYLIFYDDGRWKQLSIFPLIPSVKWALGF